MKLITNIKSFFGLLRPGWTFYKDKRMEWRWRHVGPNGKIVGASSEGFKNFIDMVDNARLNGFSRHAVALNRRQINSLEAWYSE